MKRTLITFALGATITAGTIAFYAPSTDAPAAKLAPVQAKQLVNKDAVLDALSKTPQLVGLTGDISKTVTLTDNKWFGDKTYELTLNGEFKLGIETEELDITTRGNTVVVHFPQPKLISVDLPFDQASIKKDVGLLRQDLSESELQSLYGEARKEAVQDICVNIKARERAEAAVEHALEDLIEQVPAVESVIFVD
jgi:hypothetical protein